LQGGKGIVIFARQEVPGADRMPITRRFEENLFGRIGVINGFLRREQLEECIEEERASSGRQDLGQILLRKGYITEGQLGIIEDVRKKKARKVLCDPREKERSEKTFGQVALRRGWVKPPQLEAAMLEQERLRKLNLQFRIGEVLVAMGVLTVDQILEILNEQRQRILQCPVCDFHYGVLEYHEGGEYRCRKCGEVLREPRFLDCVAVDGVIEENHAEKEASSNNREVAR
jgi:hypothetical protein